MSTLSEVGQHMSSACVRHVALVYIHHDRERPLKSSEKVYFLESSFQC